jgi:putative membrane protein
MKVIAKNDKLANIVIITLSVVVFALVTLMRRVKLSIDFGFDTHVFPAVSAFLNSIVAILLLIGLWYVKQKKFEQHKNVMLGAVVCSILFLLTYVMYHFTTVETVYGGTGFVKTLYYIILFTHIGLAGIILPFILFAVYRGLTGEYDRHKKLTKWVWPVWFYVSVTGVVVYFMISPYYGV